MPETPAQKRITLRDVARMKREGQKLVVDRLPHADKKTFHPDVLFVGGDGKAELAPKGVQVTAKIVSHTLGDKIRVGKYRRRTGYSKHTGHRSKMSEVEIQKVAARAATTRKPAAQAEEKPDDRKAPAKKQPEKRR